MTKELRRQLGLVAVMAVVAGDMMGSGIFYTPQELAPIAQSTLTENRAIGNFSEGVWGFFPS